MQCFVQRRFTGRNIILFYLGYLYFAYLYRGVFGYGVLYRGVFGYDVLVSGRLAKPYMNRGVFWLWRTCIVAFICHNVLVSRRLLVMAHMNGGVHMLWRTCIEASCQGVHKSRRL